MGKGSSGALRIIMRAADGAIAVDIPTAQLADDPDALSLHLTRLEAQGYTILKSDATGADLPNERAGQSRRFRNQWRWDGAKIEPDLPLCREQVMAEVRAERDAKLAETDGEATRNMERGRPDQGLTDYRQALRDLPAQSQAALEALGDAAALEAYTPSWPSRGA